MKTQFLVQSAGELAPVVEHIKTLTNTHQYFCFNAQMGAGKTTLIKQLCEALGVDDVISSPTYSIVNEYLARNEQTIYHFDLYRLNSEIELLDIGIEDMLDSNAICFIEWPEKMLNFLPHNYVNVSIEVKNDNSRLFTISTSR